MFLPTMPSGTPEIDDSVYERLAKEWEESLKQKDNRRTRVISTGIIDEEEREALKKKNENK